MCTVTYYRYLEKVIITSNRDEHIDRPLAIAPRKHVYNNTALYFPQDPKANGTWFVANENGNVYVLLNGAQEKHFSTPPYLKSRGIILLEIASASNISTFWKNIDLTQIEPFTIIAFFNNKLFQLRWNSKKKEFKILNESTPQIWSSSTLYESAIIKNRAEWFSKYLEEKQFKLLESDLMDFHTNTQRDDTENGIIINRNTNILTKNITQCVIENGQIKMAHFDLLNHTQTTLLLNNETLVA